MIYKKQYLFENITLHETGEEYQYINNPHDKIFRKALENKNDVAKIINRLFKENKVEANEIAKYNSSYISDKLANSESDVVYKLIDKDIFFLIEHQTKVDYSMPYRILKYEIEIMESVLINKNYKNKKYKCPLIIPIVIYTGNKKWDAENNLQKKQIKWGNYEGEEFAKYNILDINKIENKELLADDSFISKIMIIEKSKTGKELEENLEEIIKIMKSKKDIYTEEHMEFLEIILELVLKEKLGLEKVKELKLKMKEGDGKMLAVLDMIARENVKIKMEGKKEGKKVGRIEEKMEIAKKMLAKKMPINEILEITGLKKEEIEIFDMEKNS